MERIAKQTVEETVGTVSLKIARLENELKLLSVKQHLSSSYPDYQAKLALQEASARLQLSLMMEVRDQFMRVC
ncbi:MAG: hypothetical protein KDI79_28525 [Anaerolineae bacterium]|nr:hypothetical protein [Anaerolineae bacterium]